MVLLPLVMEYYKWSFSCSKLPLVGCSRHTSTTGDCFIHLHVLLFNIRWMFAYIAWRPWGSGRTASIAKVALATGPWSSATLGGASWGLRGGLYGFYFLKLGSWRFLLRLCHDAFTCIMAHGEHFWEFGSLSGVHILFTSLWLFPLVGAHPRVPDISKCALLFFSFPAVMYLWACLCQQATPLMMSTNEKTC